MVTPYRIYQQHQVQNATRIELLLGLYDKAIQHLTQARQEIDQGNVSMATPLILQAQVIVYALAEGVDLQYGEIAQNMLRLYEFILYRLGSTDTHNIGDAIQVLTTLREGLWEIEPKAKAMELGGKLPRAQALPGLRLSA